MKNDSFKEKITNHILIKGKKQIGEKIFKNTLKSIQKLQKKSHNEIIKLTILDITPTFRVVKLKKKKSSVEVPTFISCKKHRISWGIKYLVKTFSSETPNTLNTQFQKKFLLNTMSNNETIAFKDKLQNNALKKKNYFKYYRW